MKEFITNYPLFSYIAIPILFVLAVGLIILVLRPRSVDWDYFSRLYQTCLTTIDFIDEEKNSFGKENLKTLLASLSKMKFYYEMLESEELYEVEDIIHNIKKATSIARALQIAGSSEGEIADYVEDISSELKTVRRVLYGFNLTRGAEETEFAPLPNLRGKNKKKAEEYLKSIKHDQ